MPEKIVTSPSVINNKTSQCDYEFKLLLIGDSRAGKTSMLLRFVEDVFCPHYQSTIGLDFKMRTIDIEDKKIKLKIWDTAGQERFAAITTPYFRGADGILVVYDTTNRASFENVRNWIGKIDTYADKIENIVKVVIGTKCDLKDERVVSVEQGKKLSESYDVGFTETSAKDNIGVDDVFYGIARKLIEIRKLHPVASPRRDTPIRPSLLLSSPANKRSSSSSSCCGGSSSSHRK